tara:strand:+ start:364 stop:759 length:396 start_codon:yes stop_codon:yes gene_type:complete
MHEPCFTLFLELAISDGLLDIAIICPLFNNEKCFKKLPSKLVKKYVSEKMYKKYKSNILKKRFRIPCLFKQFGTVSDIEFIVCPTCESFINKDDGCDHMVCSRCLTHFCYQCGKKYDMIFNLHGLEFKHRC